MKKIVIAIDGPAASGKSTTARRVAEKLGYLHIDTGAMYRALTFKVLEEGLSPEASKSVQSLSEATEVRLKRLNGENRVFVDGRDVTDAIRTPEVTKAVSRVSSYPFVRQVMVREQRKLAESGGVVLEGRDIGTVVLPNAELKIFMVANVAERARRRKEDLRESGVNVEHDAVMRELAARDEQDSTRAVSPLRKASDALELDTSHLTVDEQVAFIVEKARELLKQ